MDAIIYWLTNAKDIGGIGDRTQVKLEDNEAEVTIYSKQD